MYANNLQRRAIIEALLTFALKYDAVLPPRCVQDTRRHASRCQTKHGTTVVRHPHEESRTGGQWGRPGGQGCSATCSPPPCRLRNSVMTLETQARQKTAALGGRRRQPEHVRVIDHPFATEQATIKTAPTVASASPCLPAVGRPVGSSLSKSLMTLSRGWLM